ncbi:hypothetical protein [Amycolatopsis sp. FDAARGOS 1241]|uniref:hypothetical protein n=1 Tax=Amycolatopsis sp. FDAARGOS 1241 TaxID=2778070 RepID=UPI00194E48A6|nr:hypothetical protein [Amycolatopsis sp. FDAARGOS 1241]QRP42796.1 hypothetical protein I6J71_25330 [Amycolatopsis sp. FDAARGOS 1241]
MSKRFLLLTATAVTAFGLTACGTNAAPTTPSFPNAPAPASVNAASRAAAAPTSASPSYLAKKVGDRAGITNSDGSIAVDFWITKVRVDPKCDPYSQREAGKHTVVMDVTVKTYTDKDASQPGGSAFDALPGLINPYAFSSTGSSGVTNQAETDMCLLPQKELPSTYAPNRTYTGQISFATPDASGKLQLTVPSGFFQNGGLGWEWSY